MEGWQPLPEQGEEPRLHCPRPGRRHRRRHYRPHRFRHHRRRRVRAVDRIVRRRRRQERVHAMLRIMSVPVLAVTPASLAYIDFPVNVAIAMPLGIMGLLLMFGRRA